jgi:predicted DNA-binding transcriptional regulator AlpA
MEDIDPFDEVLIDFAELKRRKVANNHAHLTSLINDHGFPPGFWISPNKHRWTPRSVREWLASRGARLHKRRRPRRPTLAAIGVRLAS